MEAAPRSWQFSLSNWSVTRKVGIVLVLPVLLATVFAVLRINNELRTMEQLHAATEQAIIIRPVVRYGTATEQLAIAASSSWGNIADPATAAALTRFDQALAELEVAMQTTEVSGKVTAELASAVATGSTMRNSLRNGSPAMVGEQADEIAARIGNALARSPSVDDLVIQRYFLQLGAIQSARRTLTQQQLLIGMPDAARNNPGVQAKVLISAGAEMTMIATYSLILPENAGNLRPLMDAVQTRLAAFSQSVGDPAANPVVADSLRASSDTYAVTTDDLMEIIDGSLASRTVDAQAGALREASIVIGTLLAGLALALSVARTLVVPVRRLRRDALEVAHVKLPDELAVVRAGGATPRITPVGVHSTDEIGQLARAVDEIHEQALALAAEQARLRVQIGNMFETLSRRSQSLVEQQLTLIEELEHDEDDGERLQALFRLDHLATRMRRNGDNLLVLAGTQLRRGQLNGVPLSDMLWSAVSQVEDYQRVEIGSVPEGVVPGEPAVDIEHLLAELIDNALRYSPPTTAVAVMVARAVDGGYLIEITDRGLGMASEDLQATNERLASGGEVNVETARRMGLFVVGRLAKRHTITVSLRRTSTMAQQPGITASVHLPGALVAPQLDHTDPSGKQLGGARDDGFGSAPTRNLVPVPSLPQRETASSGFGTTTNGLPQRRPAMRVADAPEQPSISVPGRGDRGGADRPRTGFGSDEPSRPTTGGFPVVDPHNPPTGTDLWAENKDDPADDGDSDRFTSRSGLPVRRPGEHAPAAVRLDSTDRSDRAAQPSARDDRRPEPAETGEQQPADRRPVPDYDGPEYATQAYRPFDRPAHTGEQQRVRRAEETGDGREQTGSSRLQPIAGESPTPIYQRMVSEWLVEPASSEAAPGSWSSPADAGWSAAADASKPTTSSRTAGGLPIRRPGAQLVPGGLAQAEEQGDRDPEEIRTNLTRHLSGVRSGRANVQYNDGGLA
ncbi:ATP-binding protein [Nocardia asteroides]|uniref:ATP-binding protein n=1 Tax=Nocardia asteroides TaxID=1824 RepID=UPI001E2BFD6A|nr:ATP-binding protein [Nocardia asteroides]UGT64450.1 ATP-binding protein [Nocardia asteroides]